MEIKILPSLLAANIGRLQAEAQRAGASGADALHLDIMDGHFVPNLSFGPSVVEMASRSVDLPMSVHLMLSRPDQYLARFIEAGAHSLFIHIEAECDVPESLARIRDLGAHPGITLNPKTSPAQIWPVLDLVDEVLCMSVQPGYGGQAFMPEVLPKIREIRRRLDEQSVREVSIMVDGGINTANAVRCAVEGADAFVAGTFLFRAADMAQEIRTMRESIAAVRAS